MAASLLASNTAAVGFGGYVGSSRVESSLSTEDAGVPFLVQSLILYSWALYSEVHKPLAIENYMPF